MFSEAALDRLPGRCVPYVLQPGEGAAYLAAGQFVRVLAGEAETGGAFGIVHCAAPRDPAPIPMHWHAREHDTWLCTRGRLQVWCKDESRVLQPGDFGYVKPGDTHSYRCIGQATEFFGVVAPGGWEKFFADAGTAWDQATFPPAGSIPPDFSRMGQAMGRFGINRVDDPVYAAASSTDADTSLPGAPASYFLQAGFGPRYVFRGLLATTLIGPAETSGLFAIQVIEGPQGASPNVQFRSGAQETIYVLAGTLTVMLEGETTTVPTGGCANLPADSTAAVTVASRSARWISTTAGQSVLGRYVREGTPTDAVTFPV